MISCFVLDEFGFFCCRPSEDATSSLALDAGKSLQESAAGEVLFCLIFCLFSICSFEKICASSFVASPPRVAPSELHVEGQIVEVPVSSLREHRVEDNSASLFAAAPLSSGLSLLDSFEAAARSDGAVGEGFDNHPPLLLLLMLVGHQHLGRLLFC